MPRRTERIVACPKCGEERATRAQRGVKLACLGCGEVYRCPAEEPDASAEAVDDGSTDVERDSSNAGTSDGFVEAKPKVRQQARPRGRGGDAPPADEPPAPPVAQGEDEDWQEKLGPRASRSSIRPKGQSRAKRAGAKGGSRRPGVYPGIVP